MTQVGTRFRFAWVVAPVALLGIASCSSSVTNQVDEKQKEGGLFHDGAAGSGGSGTGGAPAEGGGSGGAPSGGHPGMGGAPFECLSGGRSCSGGVVYESIIGTPPDGKCARPVSTCPYGCNPDWHYRDAQLRGRRTMKMALTSRAV